MKELETITSAKYTDFLKTNTIALGSKNEFDKKGCFFRIKYFYNLADADVLLQLNNEYEGRLEKGSFIIADADNGDYVLMDQKGTILFWNHEVNDLASGHNVQKPLIISKNIARFLIDFKEQSDLDIEPEVKSIKLSNDFNDLFKEYLK